MRETVQQKQSIMSIMPDLVAKQLNQNPPPAAPSRRKDSVSNKKPLLSTSVEEKNRDSLISATMTHVKSSNVATKVSTAARTLRSSKTITNKKESISQRPAREAPLQATGSVPLSGDRKPEGAVKVAVSRLNPFSSGRGESAPSNSGISVRPKTSNASQNGLPRAPLKDRSNNATKAVRK